MKHKFYIMPRQSGKTTKAVELFLENPEKSLLVVKDDVMVNEIKQKYNLITNNVKSAKRKLFPNFYLFSYQHLIFDDYLSFNNKLEFINLITSQGTAAFTTCFSTPDKIYDAEKVDFIKNIQRFVCRDYDDISNNFLNKFNCTIEEFYDYYGNLLFRPNNKIINDNSINYISQK